MGKMTLTFNMDDYDDALAAKRAMSATDAYICLHSTDEMFRRALKNDLNEASEKLIEQLRKDFFNFLEQYGIDLGDLP